MGRALVVRAADPARGAGRGARSGGAQSDRQLHHQAARKRRPATFARSTAQDAGAPRELRLDRVAADAGDGRGVRERRRSQRLREARGQAAGLAAIRRAHGDAVARRGAVRRHQRLPERRHALDVALARLDHQRIQPQHAVRPIHHRAACGRLARPPDARPDHCDRLQPQRAHERRGRHRRRGISGGVCGGPRPDDRHGLARADGGLRALPRSQVRPDQPEGFLPTGGVLQQRARARTGLQLRQRRTADQGADGRDVGEARQARRRSQ